MVQGFKINLDQGSPKYGPQAKSGPTNWADGTKIKKYESEFKLRPFFFREHRDW